MRPSRVWIAPVLAAVLWTVSVAPLLPSSGGGLMPCCEGGSPCDTSLQATGCCRIDAATDRAVGLAAVVARNHGSFKAYLPPAPALSTIGPMALALARTATSLAEDSPPHPVVVPLYLLNATLLR